MVTFKTSGSFMKTALILGASALSAIVLASCRPVPGTDGKAAAKSSSVIPAPAPSPGEVSLIESDAIGLPDGRAQVFALQWATLDLATRRMSFALHAATIEPRSGDEPFEATWSQVPLPKACSQPGYDPLAFCGLTAVWRDPRDGKVLVIGRRRGEDGERSQYWFIQRLHADLSLDTTFGDRGLIEHRLSGDGGVHSGWRSQATIQPGAGGEGYLVTMSLGRRVSLGEAAHVVAWLGPDGELDPEFGAGDPALPEAERVRGTVVFRGDRCQAVTQATFDERTRDVYLTVGPGKLHYWTCSVPDGGPVIPIEVRILKIDRHGERVAKFSRTAYPGVREPEAGVVALRVHSNSDLSSIQGLRLLPTGALRVAPAGWFVHYNHDFTFPDRANRSPFVDLDPETGEVIGSVDAASLISASALQRGQTYAEALLPTLGGRQWAVLRQFTYGADRAVWRQLIRLNSDGSRDESFAPRSRKIDYFSSERSPWYFAADDGVARRLSWARYGDGVLRFRFTAL